MTDHSNILGTISAGTHRPQDLIPAFLDAIRTVAPAEYAQLCVAPFGPIPAHAAEDDDAGWWYSDETHNLRNELQDVLSDNAPPYCYFDTREGDGADFGFFPDHDAIEMATHDKDALKVDDLSDVPDDYTGDVVVINDHGNMTVGLHENGEFSAYWSVV